MSTFTAVSPLFNPTSTVGTTTRTSATSQLTNRLLEQIFDRERYDVDDGLLGLGVARRALSTLAELDPRFQATFEVEPYWGQLNLTWRSGKTRRVKATFDADRLLVYHEQMNEGVVVRSGINQDAQAADLRNRLAWLYT